jgi:hypothetical protein
MKIEALFLLGVGSFFGMIGLIYWFTAYEDAGFLMLLGTTALGLVPGSYYYFWHRKMGDRPEDRPDAKIEDGAGVVSSFPSSSIWPFVFGIGAFVTILAFAFGVWLVLPGICVIISAVIGFTAESRRGGNV